MTDGTPPPAPAPSPPPAGVDGSAHNKAIASLILGICGILICPLACSIPALIFGKQAKDQIARSSDGEGASMAQAGFIMGIVGTALGGLAIVALLIILLAAAGSSSSPSYY